MAMFVVTTSNGPAWDQSVDRSEQRGWDAHARFMDGLVEEGVVVLGGPIGDGDRAMLVLEAASSCCARARRAVPARP
jgi:hypothetical protein